MKNDVIYAVLILCFAVLSPPPTYYYYYFFFECGKNSSEDCKILKKAAFFFSTRISRVFFPSSPLRIFLFVDFMPDAKRKIPLGAKSQWKEKQEGRRGGLIEYLYFRSANFCINEENSEYAQRPTYLPTAGKEREMLSFLNKANKCQPYLQNFIQFQK